MVLNIKLNYAKEKGILVSCLIDTDFAGFDADDLVNLLANSLDNAIESSLQQKKRKEIAIASKSTLSYVQLFSHNSEYYQPHMITHRNLFLHSTLHSWSQQSYN